MRKIRRLRDLRKLGSKVEQDFVRYFVASQLDKHPRLASPRDWEQAWRDAENAWETTVRDFADKLPGGGLNEAERRARHQLLRVAYASLARLGWT